MYGFVRWLLGEAPRRSKSFLNGIEQRRVQSFAAAIPDSVTSAQLSALGAAGAALAVAGLLGARSWPWLVLLTPVGMAVNWFGLAVDLPLARERRLETSHHHVVHHISELFSHIIIVLAYGFSPFLTLRAASIILVCYLLFSSYTYIRAATRHVEQMAYIGIGVTEFRLLLAFWPFMAMALGVPKTLDDRMPAIDVAIIAMGLFTVAGLVAKFFLDGRKIAAAASRED